MAKDINKVQLMGNIGRDPEMRFLPNGTPVTTMSLATNRQWKDDEGKEQGDTQWHNLVFWNRLAEIAYQYVEKGARLMVEGRLQTRSWEDRETGERRYKTEIVVSDMWMLGSRSSGAGSREDAPEEPASAPRRRAPAYDQDEKSEKAPARPAQKRNQPTEILDDDDIPF